MPLECRLDGDELVAQIYVPLDTFRRREMSSQTSEPFRVITLKGRSADPGRVVGFGRTQQEIF